MWVKRRSDRMRKKKSSEGERKVCIFTWWCWIFWSSCSLDDLVLYSLLTKLRLCISFVPSLSYWQLNRQSETVTLTKKTVRVNEGAQLLLNQASSTAVVSGEAVWNPSPDPGVVQTEKTGLSLESRECLRCFRCCLRNRRSRPWRWCWISYSWSLTLTFKLYLFLFSFNVRNQTRWKAKVREWMSDTCFWKMKTRQKLDTKKERKEMTFLSFLGTKRSCDR